MNLEVQRRRPRQETPSPESQAATKPLDESILSAADAFVVVVVSPYGQPRRRPHICPCTTPQKPSSAPEAKDNKSSRAVPARADHRRSCP
jgi:hypothetical protein